MTRKESKYGQILRQRWSLVDVWPNNIKRYGHEFAWRSIHWCKRCTWGGYILIIWRMYSASQRRTCNVCGVMLPLVCSLYDIQYGEWARSADIYRCVYITCSEVSLHSTISYKPTLYQSINQSVWGGSGVIKETLMQWTCRECWDKYYCRWRNIFWINFVW